MGIRHATVVTKSDDPNDERLQGSHWNADHIMPAVSEPSDPANDTSVIWMSDGTGPGDAGDIMVKITSGGNTRVTTLIDFSNLASPDLFLFQDGTGFDFQDGTSFIEN